MAGNKEVIDLPLLTSPVGAETYAVKTDTDYRLPIGIALGLATLGADGKVPTSQLPAPAGGGSGTVTSVAAANAVGISWVGSPVTTTGTLTPTLSANLQAWHALATASKAEAVHTHHVNDLTAAGVKDTTTFLRGDNVWAVPPTGAGGGGGTVTSVNLTNSTGITFTGGPITASGSILATLSANLQAWSGIAPAAKAEAIHAHAAADITSGILATARLGTGVAGITNFLRGDGSWAAVTGGGTVTSIDVSGGTSGLTFTGGPVTASGVITAAGTLAIANGGTGAATSAGALTNLGAATSASPTFSGTITLPTGGTLTNDLGFNRFSSAIRSFSTTRDQKVAADLSVWVEIPRVFVQAGDPGAASSDGDLWIF